MPREEIQVPLRRFVEYLQAVAEFDRTHPEIGQVNWLLNSFEFSDDFAVGDPTVARHACHGVVGEAPERFVPLESRWGCA